ncbi:hypothetical protein TWF706_000962 [Orbilia oligospora]|uniref:Uncharacterized protein n=1 Tax=Orbilia oligospora TaxID=2813651 RepID=A0A7C8P5S5_ORBOL|nr:hypothetical protein TWF103_009692 [Orbilia oligospora]KAF3110239.1 hypothetical protein TWF706_000962 [Orbilia oligospora]KAF3130791.1 hypothetical protein TWF703_008068 [Orbilia oligospora]
MAWLEGIEPGESNFTRPNPNSPGYTILHIVKTPPLADQIDVYRRGILSTDTRIYLSSHLQDAASTCTPEETFDSLRSGLASGNFPKLVLLQLVQVWLALLTSERRKSLTSQSGVLKQQVTGPLGAFGTFSFDLLGRMLHSSVRIRLPSTTTDIAGRLTYTTLPPSTSI